MNRLSLPRKPLLNFPPRGRGGGGLAAAALCVLLLASSAHAAPYAVTGKVLLPGGKPAVGARVWVGWAANPIQLNVLEGKAVAGGAFSIKIDAEPGRTVTLGAAATGASPAWKPLKLPEAGKLAPATITLSAPVTMAGRVLHSDGSPIAGLRVSVESLEDRRLPTPDSVVRALAGRTGADGRFRIIGLPPAQQVTLVYGELLSARGTPPVLETGTAGVRELGFLVAVRPASLRLTLMGLDGKPAPSGIVWLRLAPPSPFGELAARAPGVHFTAADCEPRPVEVDPKGLGRLDGMLPGRYELAYGGRVVPVEVKEGAVVPVRMTARTEPLVGKVALEDGKPLAMARVEVEIGGRRSTWPPVPLDTPPTSAAGEFSIAGFPWEALSLTVRVVGGGAMAEWSGSPAQLRPPLRLTARQDALVTVRGHALDSEGKALANAPLALFDRDENGPRGYTSTRTDAQGRFEAPGIRRGLRFAVGVLEAALPIQSEFFTSALTGAEQDLGDVRLGMPPGEGADIAAGLAPPPVPSAADLHSACDAAWAYVQALKSGDLGRVRQLTSALTPGYGELLASQPLVLPAAPLTREALHPVLLMPRMAFVPSLGGEFDLTAGGRVAPLFGRPDWVFMAYRCHKGSGTLTILHREKEGWKLVGGLSALPETASGDSDASLLGTTYPVPPAAAVEAGRAYLEAWKRGDVNALRPLTSPRAVEYDATPVGFAGKWAARPDAGKAGVGIDPAQIAPDTRFSKSDLVMLFSYPRMLSLLRQGRNANLSFTTGFPHDDVAAGNVAALRYAAGGREYEMLLHRRAGKWEVVEPAFPL